MLVKLSLRLITILEMIPSGSVVADIGSDHGKLMIALYEEGIISHGYAIENKPGPYEILKKAIMKAELIDHIVPMLSDGISELPSCVNTVVVAGMGGRHIIDILKSHQNKLANVSTIIVDGHSCLPLIREDITKLGYNIADEKIIKDSGVFYEIIKFVKSDTAMYNESDVEFGPILRHEKSATFKEKYSQRIKEIDNLLAKDLPMDVTEKLNKEKEKIKGII